MSLLIISDDTNPVSDLIYDKSIHNICKLIFDAGLIDYVPSKVHCTKNWEFNNINIWDHNSDLDLMMSNRDYILLWGPNSSKLNIPVSSNSPNSSNSIKTKVLICEYLTLDWDNFQNCDHFVVIAEDNIIPRNSFKIAQKSILVTDGACSGNGKKCARAGYGLHFAEGQLRGISESGRVTKKPSNNTAELTAVLRGLEIFIGSGCKEDLVIVTDSKLICNTFTIWLKNWKAKNIVETKANTHLIIPIDNLLCKIVNWQFVHVNSHLSQKQKSQLNPYVLKLVGYNEIADELANIGKNS